MICLHAGPVRALSLGVLLLLVGCSSPDGPGGSSPAPTTEAEESGEFLVFDPLALGQTGAFTTPIERVYRDEDSWRGAMDSLRINVAPGPVDFTQSMVVLLALPQESGGYSIEVQTVESRAEGLLVEYELSVPADDCIPIAGAALPFQAVTVRRADGPVTFVRKDFRYECTWRQ